MTSSHDTAPVSSLTDAFLDGLSAHGRDGIEQLSVSCDVIADDPDSFAATVIAADFGAVRVHKLSIPMVKTVRTPGRLQDEHSPYLAMIYLRQGEFHVEQNRASVSARSHQIAIVDYAATYTTQMAMDCVMTYLPHDLLAERGINSRKLGASIVPSSPLGVAFDSVLRTLLDPAERPPRAQRHIESAVLDLSLAILSERSDIEVPLEEMESGNLARAVAFIHANFHNPALNVAHVAASIHSSTRYLHKLFEGQSESVYALIKRCRVDRGIELLTEPSFSHLTISQIAFRCGFGGPSQFSRAIRDATGLTPRDVRQRAA